MLVEWPSPFPCKRALSGCRNHPGKAYFISGDLQMKNIDKLKAIDIVNKNRRLIKENESKFRDLFGLKLHDYLGNIQQLLTGFDIVKFNDAIKSPDNMSLKEFVLEKYGDEAVNLIFELINS